MVEARENNSTLIEKDYDIVGNKLKAYYDESNKLVFVVDYKISERKPNVLLVMDSFRNRKWDDVLSNDYGVDLETVRPKKDNKYQKLDIEYSGLGLYEDLINSYIQGVDIKSSLENLEKFRAVTVCKLSKERLEAAEDNLIKAQETIGTVGETISQQQEKLKELRSKLSQQKKNIGKEPTKQSAAKILKTESQIDAANEKLKRAKKRLSNAQKRLITADENATEARAIVDRCEVFLDTNQKVYKEIEPVSELKEEAVVAKDTNEERKVEHMASEEEVKPLFDKDPEILDEDIAFKPIEFDEDIIVKNDQKSIGLNEKLEEEKNYDLSVGTSQQQQAQASSTPVETSSSSPDELRFTPPVSAATEEKVQEYKPINVTPVAEAKEEKESPVINSLKPVEVEERKNQLNSITEVNNNAFASPTESSRPVSPNNFVSQSATSNDVNSQKKAPAYYILLFVLVIMSVFTLWLYQKNINNNVPELEKTVEQNESADIPSIVKMDTNVTEEDVASVEAVEENPFISSEVAKAVPVEPVQEIQPVEEVKATAVEVMEEPVAPAEEAVPVPVEKEEAVAAPVIEPQAPVVVEETTAVVVAPQEETVPVNTEAAVMVNKPAYNVSQQENMFVAAPEYETETIEVEQPAPATYTGMTCEDGSAPDANGCCAGETFDPSLNGGVCCLADGTCFPPIM